MPHIQLRISIEPLQADVFVNIEAKDDSFERIAAIIDTGAEVSLFPLDLLDSIEYRLSEHHKVTIEQAGISGQFFEATEAFIKITLEDAAGNRTNSIEIKAWFADTGEAFLGSAGILDSAILHIDTLNTRTGWIELAD